MGAHPFWLAVHRYLGLATLTFLAIAAATGCILCVRGPLDAALNPDLFRRAGPPIDAVAAVARFQARTPDVQVLSFPLHVGAGETLPVSVAAKAGGDDQLFLDADGQAVGGRATRPGWDRRHFVQGAYLFHYTLLGGTWGRWLMGLVALGWLIGAVIGLYLTLPTRGPFWRSWLRFWVVRFKARLARVLLDLHQATGLWLLLPVLVLAWTSVSMNFFDEAFTPAVQALSPARPSPFDAPPASVAPGPPLGFGKAIDLAGARAKARGLGWRPAQASFEPERGFWSVMFTNNGVVNYSRLGPVSYVFDNAGRFVYEDNPYTDSAGRSVSRSLYPLHTGKMAGLAGQVFDFILGLVTLEQSLTGLYLWLKRRGPRIAGKRARAAARAGA
jgi:uncharacterized iron-regulated membrane protein